MMRQQQQLIHVPDYWCSYHGVDYFNLARPQKEAQEYLKKMKARVDY